MLRTFSAIIISLFLSSQLRAQQKWSLKSCVEYALNNNISVQQSALAGQLAKVTMIQNKAAMLPSVNGSINQNKNFGRSVDPYTYEFTNNSITSVQVSGSANVVLFNGMQMLNNVKQSKLDYEAGHRDLEKVINDISLGVASSFLQVLYSKEQVKAAALRLESTAKQRDVIKKQVAAGVLAEGSLMDLEAQVAAEELQQINSQNTLVQSVLTLTQIMNLDSSDNFDIEEPTLELADQSILGFTPYQIYENAIALMPEVKAAELRYKSADIGVRIARGGYSPRLSAFGSIGSGYSSAAQRLKGIPVITGYKPNGLFTSSLDTVFEPTYSINTERTPFDSQMNENLNKGFGLNLSIPIFNAMSTRSNVSRAQINLQRFELDMLNTKQQILKTIQQAHADAKAAQLKYTAAQKANNAAMVASSYAEKKFAAGMGTPLEFLTAKNNATRTQSELLQAKFDLIFRIKVLEFYNGQKLTL